MQKGEYKPAHMAELSPGSRSVLQRTIKAHRHMLWHPWLVTQQKRQHFDQALSALIRRIQRLEKGILHSGVGRRKKV